MVVDGGSARGLDDESSVTALFYLCISSKKEKRILICSSVFY